MKLQRFFTGYSCEANRLNAPIRIPSLELRHQLKSVFRLGKGDNVILFDNSGYDFVARIEGFDDEAVTFTLLEKRENTVTPKRETHLFAAIVKKDTFEWIAEKATELGVSHIIPIITDRTEKKDVNFERLEKIIREAAEQSGRSTLPELHEVMELEDALKKFGEIKSIAWEPTASKFAAEDLENTSGTYIGPEGGWTPRELELFKQHSVLVRSLGPQILRAETAVVVALSKLVF